MDIEKTVDNIFNLFWLRKESVSKIESWRLSLIYVDGIIQVLRKIELPIEQLEIIQETIENYEKVKEIIQQNIIKN